MAKQYGTVRFVVNGRPKNPIRFTNMHHALLFIQDELHTKYTDDGISSPRNFHEKGKTIKGELMDMGYDGLEIKGKEYVNYNPNEKDLYVCDDIKQLIRYWEMFYENK